MPLKDSVHQFCELDRASRVIVGTFQKQHFKTKCIVRSILSFKIYQFYPNTLTPKMEELTFMSLIKVGVLKCFNAEACPKSRSMRVDLQSGANIENGTFSKTTSFSTSVPSPAFKRSRSKVRTFFVIRDGLFLILLFFKADVEVQSRILQVVIDANEYAAEVYTYDKQLLVTLTLGEGRQRFDADKCESLSEDSGALKLVQNRLMQMEQEKLQSDQEKEDLRRQTEQEKRQLDQEKEDLRRQIEQMQNDMKLQTKS